MVRHSSNLLLSVKKNTCEYPNVSPSFPVSLCDLLFHLMVRGGFLLVRGSERMTWKYDDCRCVCGLVETEMYVLFECTLYEEERERWRGAVGYLKDGMDEYELIKGYHVRSDEIEKETMRYMRVMWNSRQRHERL